MKTITRFYKLNLLLCVFILSACSQKKEMEYNEEEVQINQLVKSPFKGIYSLDPDSQLLSYNFEFQLLENGEMIVIDSLFPTPVNGYYHMNGKDFYASYDLFVNGYNRKVMLEAKLIDLNGLTNLEGYLYYEDLKGMPSGHLNVGQIQLNQK